MQKAATTNVEETGDVEESGDVALVLASDMSDTLRVQTLSMRRPSMSAPPEPSSHRSKSSSSSKKSSIGAVSKKKT